MPHSIKLLYGCGANNLYAVGMHVPDPFLWLHTPNGRTHAVLSALELERGRKHAQVSAVHDLGALMEQAKALGEGKVLARVVGLLLTQEGMTADESIVVPKDFPLFLADDLRALGFAVEAAAGAFFPERAVKSEDEVAKIRKAQWVNEQGHLRAQQILTEAEIGRDDVLFWQGAVLTSELLQNEINAECVRHGAKGFNGGPIVACGAQGADPHERGHGPLRAHEFIIIDNFPEGDAHYHGDLTRTVLKGTPTPWHKDVYAAVLGAQEAGIQALRAGVTGADVHATVDAFLVQAGFPTGTDDQGRPYGFFHSTGHALGLEVHDDGPGLNAKSLKPLQENMVVTVEPGLYYPEKGGVRIEDIVRVTAEGCENLTGIGKDWVIE